MSDSDKDWQYWGKEDPYYGVLSTNDFRRNSLDANLELFFFTGEQYISDRMNLIQQHFPTAAMGNAFDFGCGVGRLAMPMARRYAKVVGLDISTHMIAEAILNSERFGCQNIEYKSGNLSSINGNSLFDFINTFIVLQHIPVDRGLSYISKMASMLNDNGVINVHVTVDRQQTFVRKFLYNVQKRITLVNMLANIMRKRPLKDSLMQMNEYPFLEIMKIFEQNGIHSPIVTLDSHDGTLALTLLGQKN
jgi:2-polyprenyl-3-methyl-5-hydroxy-6-metoxy-1,4-benzoquinol methylase